MEKMDFHIHTDFSDGLDSLSEVLIKAAETGLTHLSITDHDTIDACEAMADMRLDGICCVAGVEVSCIHRDVDFHLLGYGIDISNREIREMANVMRDNRRKKIPEMVAFLKERHGIELPEDKERELYALKGSVGKPHLAKILISMGMEGDISAIIKRYLKECKSPGLKIQASDMIRCVKKSGGVVSLAHPGELMKDFRYSPAQITAFIIELKNLGLNAVEVYHSSHSFENIALFKEIALMHGLLVTGGSDYHGKNKPDANLGQLAKQPCAVDYNEFRPFLRALGL